METQKKKKFQLPHIYVLLFAIIVICAVLTWILPAGQFDRALNEQGREIVAAGTYHTVEQSTVGFFELFKCLYEGMCNASSVIMFVFIAYAFIGLIIASGAFDGLVAVAGVQGQEQGDYYPNFRRSDRPVLLHYRPE